MVNAFEALRSGHVTAVPAVHRRLLDICQPRHGAPGAAVPETAQGPPRARGGGGTRCACVAGRGVRRGRRWEAAREHATALKLRQSVEGRRVLLVDDVFTTGSRFHTVGKLLIETGRASDVSGLVLARVPG